MGMTAMQDSESSRLVIQSTLRTMDRKQYGYLEGWRKFMAQLCTPSCWMTIVDVENSDAMTCTKFYGTYHADITMSW